MSIMTVRAPENLREKLSCYSREIGITRNALVLMILNNWVEQKEKNGMEKGSDMKEQQVIEKLLTAVRSRK